MKFALKCRKSWVFRPRFRGCWNTYLSCRERWRDWARGRRDSSQAHLLNSRNEALIIIQQRQLRQLESPTPKSLFRHRCPDQTSACCLKQSWDWRNKVVWWSMLLVLSHFKAGFSTIFIFRCNYNMLIVNHFFFHFILFCCLWFWVFVIRHKMVKW